MRQSENASTPGPITAMTVIVAALLVLPQPAYAYIDPGTGALLWQLLAGAALGIAFVWRGFALRVKSIVRGGNAAPADTEKPEDRVDD